MPIPRKKIKAALLGKGFVHEAASHHDYFHHEVDGRRTGAYAYLSRGSGYKDYSAGLLSSIKRTLLLDTSQQLSNLIDCPMSAAAYAEHVRNKQGH